MIVRNEGAVIERCLGSVKPLIDHWTIVDTGSTDDTREKVRAVLADVPGTLHERPWRDFGHNRSEALALARPHATYSLVIDADDMLQVPQGFRWPDLTLDHYRLLHSHGSLRHWRSSLVNNRLPWHYVGVLHEYLHAEGATTVGNLPGPVVLIIGNGGRSQGISVIEKYARDARVLEEALTREPGNARYQFYLAQSYRDSGQTAKAIEAYEARAAMGGWAEEVYVALYQAAKLRIGFEADPERVVAAHLRAYEARPQRAESLCSLAAFLRGAGRFHLAYMVARRAVETPMPPDILFLEEDAYTWRPLDELAVAAYWVNRFDECAEACEKLLASPTTPAFHRPRIEKNLLFAKAKLDSSRRPVARPAAPPPAAANSRAERSEVIVSAFERAGRTVRFAVSNPNDVIQFHHYAGEFYEEEELAIISRHFPADGVFLDVGSNVGNHAIYVGLFLRPSRIIAVEPNPPAIRLLRLNVALNGLTDLVDEAGVGYAFGEAERNVAMVVPSHNLGGSAIDFAREGGIRVVPGDSVLRGRRVDFVKLDVEGCEMMALSGLAETLRAHKPKIFVELNDVNQPAMLDWMAREGYRKVESFQRYRTQDNWLLAPG